MLRNMQRWAGDQGQVVRIEQALMIAKLTHIQLIYQLMTNTDLK